MNKPQTNKVGKKKSHKSDFLIAEPPFQWTEKQKAIIDLLALKSTKCVFIQGPAGVGKTEMTVYAGLHELSKHQDKKVIFIRSVVESASNKLGYLKGSLEEKTDPYFEILNDKLSAMLSEEEIDNLRKDFRIEAKCNNFLRGKDFKDVFIICDEAQNFTFEELTTIISRVADYTKIVFLFDPDQSDIGLKNKHDMEDFVRIFQNPESEEQGIYNFAFTDEDIKRSEFCKFVMTKIRAYRNKKGK